MLRACIKSPSVKRVVHTSSVAAIRFGGEEVPDKVYDETCWTDVDFVTKNNLPGWVSTHICQFSQHEINNLVLE